MFNCAAKVTARRTHPGSRRRLLSSSGYCVGAAAARRHGGAVTTTTPTRLWVSASSFSWTQLAQRVFASERNNNAKAAAIPNILLPKLEELWQRNISGPMPDDTLLLMAELLREQYSILLPIRPGTEREQILHYIASQAGILEPTQVHDMQTTWQDYQRTPGDANGRRYKALRLHRDACTPQYERMLQRLLTATTTTTSTKTTTEQHVAAALALLLALRRDLLQCLTWPRHHAPRHLATPAQLRDLEQAIHHLLCHWFAPGLLQLQRITYDQTAATTLEFIAKREAVHHIASLDDLRQRLGPNRRVWGLYHKLLNSPRPLLVVHVALQRSIPDCMEDIQQEQQDLSDGSHNSSITSDQTIATFYSISSLEAGLRGCGLGEWLLRQAMARMRQELPQLHTFCTLSPMPDFMSWLEEEEGDTQHASQLIPDDRKQHLANVLGCTPANALRMLLQRLDKEGLAGVMQQHEHVIQSVIMPLAAYYVVLAKQTSNDNALPRDPVARFHLGNGAVVHRICWAANVHSRSGWQRSLGIMVNYRYMFDRDDGFGYEAYVSQHVGAHALKMAPSVFELVQQTTAVVNTDPPSN